MMAFVKAGESYQSTDVGEGKSPKGSGAGSIQRKDTPNFDIGNLQSALKEFRDASQVNQSSELLDKFYTLKGHLPECLKKSSNHPISGLHMAVDKSKLTVVADTNPGMEKGKFCCVLKLDYIQVASAVASNKKTAKSNAYEQAVNLLKEPYLKIEGYGTEDQKLLSSKFPFEGANQSPVTPTSAREKLMQSTFSNVTKLGQTTSGNIHALAKRQPPRQAIKRGSPHLTMPIEHFLLMEHHASIRSESVNATATLNSSAAFNKVPIEYDFREESVAGTRQTLCQISLQGTVMAEAPGTGQQVAKQNAAEKLLGILRQKCWTIQIKQAADSDQLGLNRDEVMGDIQKNSEAIPDSNIGSKLLKAMGWKGGGVGKKGTGIAEPVSVESVINREGLGLQSEQGISKDFVPAIKEIVRNYIKSNDQGDLKFSPDFSKEERALIHKECQKLGLKTHSHGSGDERFLVASRKRTANQLFNHIIQSGGETSKYVLLEPGTQNH